jgi:hypothetical protein
MSLPLASPPSRQVDKPEANECKKKKEKSIEIENQEWCRNFGKEGAQIIRDCVNANLEDYEYLKSFALKA